jgi:hypothetical protein
MDTDQALPRITLVSCAGPDDRTNISELVSFSLVYPESEIGIQVSAKRSSAPEYPSHAWIRAYAAQRLEAQRRSGGMGRAALHVNGRWCRSICSGQMPQEVDDLWNIADGETFAFSRLQLNFDALEDGVSAPLLAKLLLSSDRPVILQVKAPNIALIQDLAARSVPFDALFDASGGLGIRPGEWPRALNGRFNAWAGGLGPDTAATDFPAIAAGSGLPGGVGFGVDAQRKLRTPGTGEVFEILRAGQFVEAARLWNLFYGEQVTRSRRATGARSGRR